MFNNPARYGIFFLLWVAFSGLSSHVTADDWSASYRHRHQNEISLRDSLLGYGSSTRKIFSLNGAWQARKINEQEWRPVTVPGAYDFEGELEFHHTFKLDSSFVGKSLKLVAFGINNRCTILINNHHIVSHEGGHTSFSADVPSDKLMLEKENDIQIFVDSSLRPRTTLPLRHRPGFMYNFGGIFRDIFLLAVPKVFIDDVQIGKKFSADFRSVELTIQTQIRTDVTPAPVPFDFHVEIWDTEKAVLLASSTPAPLALEANRFEKTIYLNLANVNLWSPETPSLYELRAIISQDKATVDELRVRIGLAEIKNSGKDFLLNGQPYLIKGFDWYEEFPNLGPTAGWNTIQEEVLRIKSTGANTLRVVGTPPHPFLAELCDEVGLLLFQELPLSVVPDNFFSDSHFVTMATNYLQELVARDARHVCLAGVGIGSDLNYNKPASAKVLDELKNLVLNRTGLLVYLVTRDVYKFEWPTVADFVILDAYNNEPDALQPLLNQIAEAGRPYLISMGYPTPSVKLLSSSSGFDGPQFSQSAGMAPLKIKAEQSQVYHLLKAWQQVNANKTLNGVLIHTFADWTDVRPNVLFGLSETPAVHPSGVVSMAREKRMAFAAAEAIFKNQQLPDSQDYLPYRPNPNIYPIGGLGLILFFLFNLNRSRRLRGNLRRIFLYPHGFYMELRDRRKIPLLQTLLLSVVVCGLVSILLSSIAFRFREDALLNESLDLLIGSNSVKHELASLIWRPLSFILTAAAALFVSYCALSLFLKIIAFVIAENLPVRQFFTQVVWASANFVWLLPIVPIYFRIISKDSWSEYAIGFVLLFVLWFGIRLFRSVRMVYNLSFSGMLFLCLILSIILLGGVWWYLDSHFALFDYLPIYWNWMIHRALS